MQQNTLQPTNQICASLITHPWPKGEENQRHTVQIPVSSRNAEFPIPILHPMSLSPISRRIKPDSGFADLSARRTFGQPIGRPKVRFNPVPRNFLAEKMAESPAGLPAGRSAGQTTGPFW